MIFYSFLELDLLKKGYHNFEDHEKQALMNEIHNKTGEDIVKITDEFLFDYTKDLKKQFLKDKCEESIEKGFTATNGYLYRTNRDDQINMVGQRDELLEDESISEVLWKTEDAGYIQHTREEWLSIYKQGFAHKKEQLFKYDMLKQQVNNALTHEEITSIVWDKPEATEETNTTTEPTA
jgi:hypothetical protein